MTNVSGCNWAIVLPAPEPELENSRLGYYNFWNMELDEMIEELGEFLLTSDYWT